MDRFYPTDFPSCCSFPFYYDLWCFATLFTHACKKVNGWKKWVKKIFNSTTSNIIEQTAVEVEAGLKWLLFLTVDLWHMAGEIPRYPDKSTLLQTSVLHNCLFKQHLNLLYTNIFDKVKLRTTSIATTTFPSINLLEAVNLLSFAQLFVGSHYDSCQCNHSE